MSRCLENRSSKQSRKTLDISQDPFTVQPECSSICNWDRINLSWFHRNRMFIIKNVLLMFKAQSALFSPWVQVFGFFQKTRSTLNLRSSLVPLQLPVALKPSVVAAWPVPVGSSPITRSSWFAIQMLWPGSVTLVLRPARACMPSTLGCRLLSL